MSPGAPVLPPLSVLIVEQGDDPLTRRAVDAVRRSDYPGWIELLVHRNGGTDGDDAAPGDGIDRLIRTPDNRGFGPANNTLAAAANGCLLLLLNNDVIVTPSCLSRLVDRLLAGDPLAGVSRPGAVVPQFRRFDGSVLELGAYVDGGGAGWQAFRRETLPPAMERRGYRCAYGSAACLLIRRDDFLAAGGFDPVFAPAYYEDTDLCHRLASAGRAVLVEPRAVAFHLEGGTSDRPRETATPTAPPAGDPPPPLAPSRSALIVQGRTRFVDRWRLALRHRAPTRRESALAAALWGADPPTNETDGRQPPQPLRIVWLLPETLQPDRSGGNARVHREVTLLAAAGCQQLVWSEQGGDDVRVEAALAPLGVRWGSFNQPVRWPGDARPAAVLDTMESLLAVADPDLVILWSWGLAASLGERVRAQAPRARLVVDIGVLAYLQMERATALALDEPSIAVSRERELAVYAQADAVIASSRLEAELLTAALPEVEVLAYDVGAHPPIPRATVDPGHPLVFLGNFLHPPNTDAIRWWLEAIAPVLERELGEIVPLRVVGNASERVAALDPDGRRLLPVGWVEDLGSELGRSRVTVAPLRFGAGTKDKLAQAMRCGCPVVTTAVGAESMPDDLRRAMLVEDRPLGFARAVARLLREPGHWEERARRTRAAAARAWAAQRVSDEQLVASLHALAGRPLPAPRAEPDEAGRPAPVRLARAADARRR